MPTYSVRLPVSGYIVTEVEADSPKAAIEAALEQEFTAKDIEEWEVERRVCYGNVCSHPCREADAEEI